MLITDSSIVSNSSAVPLPSADFQKTSGLDGHCERLIPRQCVLFQPLGQRVALQVLHDQEVDPVLGADIVKGADVRVVQAGDGLRLALEPLLQIGGSGDMLREGLDGDGSV